MALIPHKADPNYDEQMKLYAKDNSRWGGADMMKGMPKPSEVPTGRQPAQFQQHNLDKQR